MVATHTSVGAAATIAVQTVSPEATRKYGIVAPRDAICEGSFTLADIVEKPGPENAPSNLAVCARYIFSPVLFDYLDATAPGHGGEVQLTDAIRAMIADGLTVCAVPLAGSERRLDVGDFSSYARAFMSVMLNHPEYGSALREWTAGLLDELAHPAPEGQDRPPGE